MGSARGDRSRSRGRPSTTSAVGLGTFEEFEDVGAGFSVVLYRRLPQNRQVPTATRRQCQHSVVSFPSAEAIGYSRTNATASAAGAARWNAPASSRSEAGPVEAEHASGGDGADGRGAGDPSEEGDLTEV